MDKRYKILIAVVAVLLIFEQLTAHFHVLDEFYFIIEVACPGAVIATAAVYAARAHRNQRKGEDKREDKKV